MSDLIQSFKDMTTEIIGVTITEGKKIKTYGFIDPNGHKRISSIANTLWLCYLLVFYWLAVLALIGGSKWGDVAAAILVAWQLMAGRMLDSANKLHDNAVTVEKNADELKKVCLSVVTDYYKIFEDTLQDYSGEYKNDYERCLNSINIMKTQLLVDLKTYQRSMTKWKIFLNIINWKSPPVTPLLEKGVAKEILTSATERMNIILKKIYEEYDEYEDVCDISPEVKNMSDNFDKIQFYDQHHLREDISIANCERIMLYPYECVEYGNEDFEYVVRKCSENWGGSQEDWRRCNTHLVGYVTKNPILKRGTKIIFPHSLVSNAKERFFKAFEVPYDEASLVSRISIGNTAPASYNGVATELVPAVPRSLDDMV